MVEGKEAVEEVRKFLREFKPDLTINRFPKPHLFKFKELAKNEFGNDYGMTVINLMTKVELFDMFAPVINETVEKVSELVDRMIVIEDYLKKNKVEEKTVTTVSGAVLKKIGKKEEKVI